MSHRKRDALVKSLAAAPALWPAPAPKTHTSLPSQDTPKPKRKRKVGPPRGYGLTYRGFVAAHNDGLMDAIPDMVFTAGALEELSMDSTETKGE